MKRAKPDRGFLYVVASTFPSGKPGPIKVGISKHPNIRLEQLRTASPYHLDLFEVWDLCDFASAAFFEEMFHTIQKKRRLKGEWFRMCPYAAVLHIEVYLADTIVRNGKSKWPDVKKFMPFGMRKMFLPEVLA